MWPWRRIESWVKRAVVRICLKFPRSRFARFVRKIGEASADPLFITGAGAFLGVGIASAAVCPLAYGALIGAGVTMAGAIVTKLYLKNAADARSQTRLTLTYTIWSRKEKANAGRFYVVETSSTIRLF